MSLLVVELRAGTAVGEPRHHAASLLIGDPAGATVDDGAVGIERAEIPPRGHVAGMQRHAEARRRSAPRVPTRTGAGRSRTARDVPGRSPA